MSSEKSKIIPNFYEQVGERIKELRKESKLTQDKLAELVQVKSKVTISDWEKGKHLPNAAQLAKLSEIFLESIDYIVTGYRTESLIAKQVKERENEIKELRQKKEETERKYKSLENEIRKVAEKTNRYKNRGEK